MTRSALFRSEGLPREASVLTATEDFDLNLIWTLQTGPVLVRVFRCIFLAGKGTEDDEGIAFRTLRKRLF
jgi:hypothetical protein